MMTPEEKYELTTDTLQAVSELKSARPIHIARKVARIRSEKAVMCAKEKRYKNVWDVLNSGFFTNRFCRYTLNEKGKSELDRRVTERTAYINANRKRYIQKKRQEQGLDTPIPIIHDLFEEQPALSTLSQVSDRFTTAGLELRMLVDELKSLMSQQRTVNQRMLHLIEDT